MKVLVTGSAGFIGFHLCKALLNAGFDIVGLDNMNNYYDVSLKEARLSELSNDNFAFVNGDIADVGILNKVFEKDSFEIVIHLAAQAGVRYSLENPQAYINSNLVGFANTLEVCRKYKPKHLVFASSSSIYGNQKKTPFSESDLTDAPVSLYAATKKSGELLAHSYSALYDLPITGLRFFTVYGEFGRPDMAYYKFTHNVLSGIPIDLYNNGNLERDFTYVDDIVFGIMNLLKKIKENNIDYVYRIYNLGNNRPVKLLDFVQTIERITEKSAIKNMMPMQQGDVYTTFADIASAQKDLDFWPKTNIEEGLSKFVNWYREYHQI